jgi:SAM-dependent methyltransferase
VIVSAGAANPLASVLDCAREAAHPPGEYVGQQSFMRASEIRALAGHAGISAGVSVLDLCCGIAGPGRFITGETGCRYLGVDRDAPAIETASRRARGLPCRFVVAEVPPLPRGRFDVVLLLETMLAFRDKPPLLAGVAGALHAGGRFAFTLEDGPPLTRPERRRMPGADSVWLTPLDDMRAMLVRAGLVIRRQRDVSSAHRATAVALHRAYASRASAIAAEAGAGELDGLLRSHRLWIDWLATGRVRKLTLVAEREPTGRGRYPRSSSARTSRTSWSLCRNASTRVETARRTPFP